MNRIALALLAGALIGGCGTTKQLSDFKKDEAAKNYAAIENQTIDSSCFAGGQATDECAQLTEIQGRACLTLARQEAAPNAACPPATDTARRRLQCAAKDFGVALTGGHFSADDQNDMTEMRARALYCGATLVSRADGLPDAREAARELDTLPANPQRDQLAAAAALYVANSEQLSTADRCAAAQLAAARATRGLQNNPSSDMQRGLSDTRAHAVSVASHLTDCRVP
jgi:hypothetical protein